LKAIHSGVAQVELSQRLGGPVRRQPVEFEVSSYNSMLSWIVELIRSIVCLILSTQSSEPTQ
jgi:hypothetical protein